jgi:iron(III) transport system ATP-binding protein
MAELIVRDLYRSFGPVVAVDRISFTVADGEFVTLLGPSGCGKSTTLAAIAGLDRPDGGHIAIGGKVFYDEATGVSLPPEARNCGLVFQSYALWPHMTVFDNLAFPLKLRRVARADRERRIAEVLALVEMGDFAQRYPHQLSGGQQQRVALARTLVYRPALLLLDEPLSNLDAKLRDRARTWLSDLQHKVGLTTVYVTHDQTEALALSDRIAVMNGGRIAQLGTPEEIYVTPADPFVADFIGSSNFFEGTLDGAASDGGLTEVRLGDGQTLKARSRQASRPGAPVVVAVRPERIGLARTPGGSEGEGTWLRARITARSYLGARYQYQVEVAGQAIRIELAEPFDTPELHAFIPHDGGVVFANDRPAR